MNLLNSSADDLNEIQTAGPSQEYLLVADSIQQRQSGYNPYKHKHFSLKTLKFVSFKLI